MHKINLEFSMSLHLALLPIFIAKDIQIYVRDPDTVAAVAEEPVLGAGLVRYCVKD